MAFFSSLPNELLACISYFVYPGDIVSFSALNRRTHLIAAAKLAKHKELHFKWALMDDHGLSESFPGYAFFWPNLLRNMLVGSPMALYIEHLRIGTSAPRQKGYLIDHNWDQDMDGMDLIRYQPLIDEELHATFNPQFSDMSIEEYCKYFSTELAISISGSRVSVPVGRNLNPISVDLARAQLLPLLTNLRVLEVHSSGDTYTNELRNLVRGVVMENMEPPASIAFCNLTTVILDIAGDDDLEWESPFDLHAVSMFMALPSIRYVEASNLREEEFVRSPYVPGSRTTHLALTDTNIDPEALSGLLEDGAPLESFTLNGGGCTLCICTGRLDQVLLANAKDTLLHLELVGPKGLEGCVQLQHFTNLRYIIVSDIYLDFPRQPLYELFHPSLQVLGINCQGDKRRLITGLLFLLDRKREILPDLTELRVRTAWDPAEKTALRRASKAVGVKLVALKYSRYDFEALLRI